MVMATYLKVTLDQAITYLGMVHGTTIVKKIVSGKVLQLQELKSKMKNLWHHRILVLYLEMK
jgi:hypothetical protein